ncbi:MAG: flagellar type III secretion system pore protein FliP [Thermodesulfobacteriota bacterium]|nr:flagellar type III secretion system pore protein FliP [Thermodesulfobacteriota bacterium]
MTRLVRLLIIPLVFLGVTVCSTPQNCWGAAPASSVPLFSIGLDKARDPGDVAVVLQIFALLTVLSLAPAILIMLTSFTRIAIVLSLLRQAIGTHQMPSNQIIVGLSLFLTFFIMSPVWERINENALQPYLEKEISQQEALENASMPIRSFMFKQTREKDLALLVDIAGIERPKNIDDVPTSVLVPSFMISELKTAFQIGFMLYIPFLIIDIVVASILLSMGMMMLPPIMISLPFKLILFVLADGWYLIVGSLAKSFG